MTKQAKPRKTKKKSGPDLGKVAELLMEIRNESNRVNLMVKMPRGNESQERERQRLLEESHQYVTKRCDEIDKVLGIKTKIDT